MNTFSRTLKAPLLCLVAGIFIVPVTMAFTDPGQTGQTGPTGDLSVVGEVSVNGTSAISGATVFSDSTITTAARSSAVVSLGKLGRVEVMPQSTMKLSFTATNITVSMREAGRVRLSSSSGVAATATTKDGQIVAKDPKMNKFNVDTSCGNTVVMVQAGRVELRAGNSVKQIAAGSQDTAGTATPGCKPSPGRS